MERADAIGEPEAIPAMDSRRVQPHRWRTTMNHTLISLAVCAALAGCASVGDALRDNRYMAKAESTIGGLFSSRIERLEKLVAEGKDTDAEAFLATHAEALGKPDVQDRADSARATLLWRRYHSLAGTGQDEAAQRLLDGNTTIAARFSAEQKSVASQVDRRLALARLKGLVTSGQYREAVSYVQSSPRGLDRGDAEVARLAGEATASLARAAEATAAQGAGALAQLGDAELASPERWREIAGLLGRAARLEDDTKLLETAGLTPPAAVMEMRRRAESTRTRLVALAPAAFETAALQPDVDLERAYPARMPQGIAASSYSRLEPRLAKAGPEVVERFARKYGSQLQQAQRTALAQVLTSRLLATTGKSGAVAELLVSERVRAAGLPATRWAERAAVVLVDQESIREGIVQVTATPSGWTVVHGAADLDTKALRGHPELAGRDVAFVVRLTAPKVRNESHGRQSVQSRFLAGYREVPNGRRQQLASSLAAAERTLASSADTRAQLKGMDYGEMSRGSKNLAILASLANEWSAGSAASDVASLRAQLSAEPATVSEPDYRSYAYAVDTRRVSKQAAANWTLLDLRSGRSIAGQEMYGASKDFKVVSGVDDRDENAGRIRSAHATPDDLQAFASQPVAISVAEMWGKVERAASESW
jgi:hypothetical protein